MTDHVLASLLAAVTTCTVRFVAIPDITLTTAPSQAVGMLVGEAIHDLVVVMWVA